MDPTPFIPEGLEIEVWARPTRGWIVINGNPPRRHDEYAIISLTPPPPPDQLHNAMEVVTFLEEVQHAVVRSCCLSPLGLCLVQFSSSLEWQIMISRSPMQLDEVREIAVVEHDRGLTFTVVHSHVPVESCFWHFHWFSDVRDYLASRLFGSIANSIDNVICRSRIILRCEVTMVSRIPKSIIISEGNAMGDHGNSWTVPIFVLNSNPNDVMAGDEDPIPVNGNPHPEHPQQNADEDFGNQFLGIFQAVQDLNEIQQENVNHGWEQPPPLTAAHLDGWNPWSD
jgi:hypothetical protein